MKHATIKLSLLENSHAFLKEAVANAIQAASDPHRWQFAILHLVQANELGLKAALEKVHPAFIYAQIDGGGEQTVTPNVALARLQDPRIGKMQFSDKDKRRIRDAIELRNEVTHQHFELSPQYGAAKFFALLPFVLHFQEKCLRAKIAKVISEEARQELFQIEKAFQEFVEAARDRIQDECVDASLVRGCPSCEQSTFVLNGAMGTCYTCRHRERLVKCEHCGERCMRRDLMYLLPWEYVRKSPAVVEALETYGGVQYLWSEACPRCFERLQEDGGVQHAQDLAGSAWANEQCDDEDEGEGEDEPAVTS